MSSKSNAKIKSYFEDILECIHLIQEYIGEHTFEFYLSNSLWQDAVERRLQIITEAAARLGDQGPLLCPSINWRDVRDYGNFLRHEYNNVSGLQTWTIAHDQLPELDAAVKSALQKLEDSLEPKQ